MNTPTEDPAPALISAAVAKHLGFVDEALVKDLMVVVAADRVRLARLDADAVGLSGGGLDPEFRQHMGEDPEQSEPLGVWTKSAVSPLGVYTCQIDYNHDVSRNLTRGDLDAYCAAMELAVAQAEHDAAVLWQLQHGGPKLPAGHAGSVVTELREKRPTFDQAAVRPLIVRPSVGHATGLPFLHIRLAGTKQTWQWGPDDAQRHINGLRMTFAAAALDNAYFRYLTEVLGLPGDRARQLVTELNKCRRPRTGPK